MIRTVSFIQRRAGIDRRQFRDHYENEHVPLATSRLVGLRHYVRNHPIEAYSMEGHAFDAISEFEYADRAAFEATLALLAGPDGEPLRRDETKFMEKAGNSYFRADRFVVGGLGRPQPGSAPKAMVLFRGREGASRGDLAERAREVGASLCGHREVNHVELDVAREGDPLGAPAWEVLLHAWYERDAEAGGALEALADRFSGEAPACCIWVEECGDASIAPETSSAEA
ncbi:MAG: EthD domain-containing protein [Myxococcota bacterium]|nr:EthD domain-containing protein [Myxococcota bacterium]